MRPAAGIWLLIAGLLFVSALGFADIGENFTAAGMALSGGLNVSFNLGNIFAVDNEFYSISGELNPAFHFFIRDNLALSLVPLFQFKHDHLSDAYIFDTMLFGLGGGLAYFLVRNPGAETGLVPAVGLSLGAAVRPGLDSTEAGIKVENNSLSIPIFLEFPVRLLYFVKPRVAPELSIVPRFFVPVFRKDQSGQVIDTPFLERVSLETSFYLGVTWFFPPRDVALLEKK